MKTVLPTKLNETKLNVYLITFEVTISSLLCFIRILITGIYSDSYFTLPQYPHDNRHRSDIFINFLQEPVTATQNYEGKFVWYLNLTSFSLPGEYSNLFVLYHRRHTLSDRTKSQVTWDLFKMTLLSFKLFTLRQSIEDEKIKIMQRWGEKRKVML